MSSTRASVHVRGAGRAEVRGQIVRRMGRRGFELVVRPARSEPVLVRTRLVERGGWVSLSVEDDETPDAWARLLARELGVPALGAWLWDGEATLELRLFERDAPPEKLSLPGAARRALDGRVVIPLGSLSRLVAKARTNADAGAIPKQTGLELRVRAEEATFDEEDRCVYLPEDVGQTAICRAFGIVELFVDPRDEDAEDADEILHFRPKPTSAIGKRLRAESDAEARERRAEYDGRVYTVGWLAFDASPREIEGLLRTTARPIVDTLTPHLGARVLLAHGVVVGKGERPLPAPAEGEAAWKRYARELREGALVDLGRRETPAIAAVWLVLRDGAIVVGWSMRGLKDPAKRTQLAAAMDGVLASATEDPRCFGAVLTCQRSPMSLAKQALAHEYLRGTSALALRPDSYRALARAPGFRVLVPLAAGHIDGEPPAGVTMRAARAGTVLRLTASDPHEVPPAIMDALERYLDANAAIAPPAGRRDP